ncbi:VOC family protein [Calycomorphotria hydatis]|nr:VOC family protein [Calycomorphotria hydatis]
MNTEVDNDLTQTSLSTLCPFHIAFPVSDLEAAREFYGNTLGCEEGRSSDTWIDFNLYGHQIVAHYKTPTASQELPHSNGVDGHDVPVPHFGVVLPWDEWHRLSERLQSIGIEFVIEPYIRFAGEVGEQATMFFLDPSGNALEFKSFRDVNQLFTS